MIEIPGAAIAVSDILREADFVSVGTNDLLQYFMAADRDNDEVFRYGDYRSEAFFHLLRFVIERASEMGRVMDVTICGEMASDASMIPRLLGLGFRIFSISPVSAQSVRSAIAGTDLRSSETPAEPRAYSLK